MADNQGAATTSLMRDYRKGNWTVSETMILIEAKKMDDERRMKRSTGNESEGGSIRINKPAELRWKWVEDYCWRKGCMRSQNQCNDKWDNLMRDYKKVRDYERKVMADHQGISTSSATDQSYWKLEKNERKDKNLPTNMLPQIYEALVEVVEKKPPRALAALVPITSTAPATVVGYNVVERSSGGGGGGSGRGSGTSIIHHHQQQTPLVTSAQALLQHHISPSPITALPLPPAVPAAPSPMQAQPLQYPQPILPTVHIFIIWRCVIAQILIQVRILLHTHQQRGEEEQTNNSSSNNNKGRQVQVQELALAQAHQIMKWLLPSPKALPL